MNILKTQRIQAAFARKRELEHLRNEQTSETNRYFQNWGKITSRFENWTTPEYYKQANQQLHESRAKKEKEQRLDERRSKLRDMFAIEKAMYDAELLELQKPRSARLRKIDNGVLEKVQQNIKMRNDLKRRLELEAKLYGRWRHGVDDESILYDSKSNNEVLAKLNWLDREIENQMEREKEENIAKDRNLRLQEELRKTEETHKDRQKIREQEIREIRALQEAHMQQLNDCQAENERLKSEESKFESNLEDLIKVTSFIEGNITAEDDIRASSSSRNLNQIKMTIRGRSELFRDHLKRDINILETILSYATCPDVVVRLIGKLSSQLESELRTIAQIEAMYESEAKHCLKLCEEMWRKSKIERQNEMRHLLKSELQKFSTKLEDNRKRQSDLIELRSTHISSIENLNEKLKLLIKEEDESPRTVVSEKAVQSPRLLEERSCSVESGRSSSMNKLSNSFTNLNMDVWKDVEPLHGDVDSPRQLTNRSVRSVQSQQSINTDNNSSRPKFGRKRIAWT